MECKNNPNYDAENSSEDAVKHIYCSHLDLKIVIRALFCLAVVLLISNVYLHYMCFTLSQEVAKQRKILDQGIKPKTFPVSEIPDVQKRNSSTHRRRQNRQMRNVVNNLKNTVNFLLRKPVLHLDGFLNYFRLIRQQYHFSRKEPVGNPVIRRSCYRGCFKWPYPSENTTSFDFEYMFVFEPHDYVMGIKIRVPGYYMIYSQVAVYGPDVSSEIPHHHSPGYYLVAIRDGVENILMESRVSQDNRGQPYRHPSYPEEPIYPLDTINQLGVFNLKCGDIVLLKPCEYSSNATFFIARDISYFGLFMTNPNNKNMNRNDYDCSGRYLVITPSPKWGKFLRY